MSIKSASTVFGMPFGKNPRLGQKDVFDKVISETNLRNLNVQLPTGYGKSFVNAGVYSILKKQGRVNRLLIIVPTTAQKDQFICDGPSDFKDACVGLTIKNGKEVQEDLSVIDIGYFGMKECIGRHRRNQQQIFITTPQAMIRNCGDIVKELMQTGSWMITVDEYHHYGLEKSWGESIKNLPYTFLLAMSATPYRTGNDSAFGVPNLKVSYRDATQQNAVKKLVSHSYVYRLDLLDNENNIQQMSTCELAQAAKSDNPESVERFIIERQMRWSPKYVSPLVTHPIERLLRERIKTGYKLQAIVGAMCVSHAKLVCEQIRKIFPNLNVDWVGTFNKNLNTGRSDEENRAILNSFCPPKDKHGQREPTLDVLVHVGMAGEGLDSVHVSEVIHLNKASINNSNNQENGRASRFLKGVVGNINFDSSSEYAVKGYVGPTIMDAMDMEAPQELLEDEEEKMERLRSENKYEELPEEPMIRIWNMELDSIDSGSPEVEKAAKALIQVFQEKYPSHEALIEEMKNPSLEIRMSAIELLKEDRKRTCEEFNEQAIVEQWKEVVKNALQVVANLVSRYKSGINGTTEKSYAADVNRAINGRKMRELGKITKDVEVYKKHYNWLKNLEQTILKYGPPSWMP